jgi:ELL-associated factor
MFLFFSGHLKDSSQKECVLIIDRVTGEITLEKLSGTMLLKKTRQERPESKLDQQLEKEALEKEALEKQLPQPPSASVTASSSSYSRPQTPVTGYKKQSPGKQPNELKCRWQLK